MYRNFLKRILDFILSLVSLLVLSPLLIVIAFCIKVDSKGPVLFTQKRIGIHKKTFTLFKFRTMKTETPHNMPTHLLENPDQWITRVGRFLRKTSIDELPQLINILLGNMAIVGPRPALWNQEDLIAERDKYGANDVRPGLTGWAQINGRDALEIPDKARYDGDYVKKITFGNDVVIIAKTALKVLRSDGVVEGKHQ